MKPGWERKKIHEICELVNGRAYSKPELLSEGKYRVLRVGNFFTNENWYFSDMELDEKKYCDTGDLLYAWSASFGPRIWNGGKVIFHYHIWKVIHFPSIVDQRFLYHFFHWDTEKIKEDQGTGTTMTHVSMGSMNDRDILIPPLAEQKRIVGILDEAFAAIDTAKSNAEKNLQNARALFESHLNAVFSQRGEGWVEKRMGECFRLKSGEALTSKEMKDGVYPVYGGNGIAGMHNLFNLSGENVIIGRVGALCGNSRHINEKIWLTDNAFKIVEFSCEFDLSFLTYILNFKNLRSFARQAAQPVISNSSLKDLVLQFPEVQKQRHIVAQLDTLATETQHLSSIYQRKLDALEELKKSLLHRAFSGDL